MNFKDVTAKWTSDGLTISGVSSDSVTGTDASKVWKAVQLGANRFLVFAEGGGDPNPAVASGIAICSSEMLYDFLIGVNHRRWSGMVLISAEGSRKKLYFNSGECVFAASDLMDDRLGEVIYREAMISVEQLANFAVQVDRKTKFGQVLLRSGGFTNTDLWNALKMQVREIFRSVFLLDKCYLEIHQDTALVEIAFEEGTESLLESAFSYGSQFKAFRSRIQPDQTKVLLVEAEDILPEQMGTFYGDIVELCRDMPLVRDVLIRSKLTPINTLVAMQKLLAKGQIKMEGWSEPVSAMVETGYSSLKAKMDGYQVLHQLVSDAFKTSGQPIPYRDLASFALSLNSDGGAAIYLDREGALIGDSMSNILQQCVSNSHRIRYFQPRLEALVRYLLQMSGDLLPPELAKKVRAGFKEIVS